MQLFNQNHTYSSHILAASTKKFEDTASLTTEITRNVNPLFRNFAPLEFVAKFLKTPKRNVNKDRDENVFVTVKERNKRSPKSHVEATNINESSRINRMRSTTRSIESRKKGYVNVNLIPRPTAIVKLHENKQKKGRMRKFLNRFRFRKRNKIKKAKKHKRETRDNRVQRFNLLKALKQIFQGPTSLPKEAKDSAFDVADYDMMTSHIDTFKPVKFNKVLSLDDLKGQVPNISYFDERSMATTVKSTKTPLDEPDSTKKGPSPPFEMPFQNPFATEVYETTQTGSNTDSSPMATQYTG